MLLKDTKPRDVIRINEQEFRVLRIKRVRVKPDTIRRHPDRIRSHWLATLQHLETGKLRSQYFAEHINCQLVINDLVLTDHAAKKEVRRNISRFDMEFIVQYGASFEWLGARIFHMEWAQISHLVEYHHLKGINVVTRDGIIITAYKKKRK